MERIPILRMGGYLLVTIQVDMHDKLALTLQDDLTNRIAEVSANGTHLGDPVGEIILKGERQLVVHVYLNGDEQVAAHSQDWNALHQSTFGVVAAALSMRVTLRPLRSRARRKASA